MNLKFNFFGLSIIPNNIKYNKNNKFLINKHFKNIHYANHSRLIENFLDTPLIFKVIFIWIKKNIFIINTKI